VRARGVTAVAGPFLLLLILGLSLLLLPGEAFSQEPEPGPAAEREEAGAATEAWSWLTREALSAILAETGADRRIISLAGVLIPEMIELVGEEAIELAVLLQVAAGMEEFAGLEPKGWLRENLGVELDQTQLKRINQVKQALEVAHRELYRVLQERLRELIPEEAPPPAPGPGTGAEAQAEPGELAAALEELSGRLSKLEEQVGELTQSEEAISEQLARLAGELEGLKAQLPDQESLALLGKVPSRLDEVESEVGRLSGSLGRQRGLVLFLLVLVILMLIWLIWLRVRELTRVR